MFGRFCTGNNPTTGRLLMAKARASLVTARQLIAISCQRPRALEYRCIGFFSFGLLGASPSARKTVLDAINASVWRCDRKFLLITFSDVTGSNGNCDVRKRTFVRGLLMSLCQLRTLIQQEARATTRASKNAEVWSGSAQVGWPNALVTPVLSGSTVASVTF